MTDNWLDLAGPAGRGAVRMGIGLRNRPRPADAAEPGRFIRCVLDSGVKLLDVLDRSPDGGISRLVGAAVRPRREQALIAAHLGWHDRTSLTAQCHEALSLLGTDYLDVCFLHTPHPGVSLEDRVGELSALVAAGLIRHLGFRATTAEDVRRVHAAGRLLAVAVDYSLAERHAETGVLPTVRELGIGIMARRPLAGGLLVGNSPLAAMIGRERLRTARRIASEADLSTTRLALAWLLAQGTDIVPVVGCGDRVHVEMDLAALDTRIPDSALDALSAAFAVDSTAQDAVLEGALV